MWLIQRYHHWHQDRVEHRDHHCLAPPKVDSLDVLALESLLEDLISKGQLIHIKITVPYHRGEQIKQVIIRSVLIQKNIKYQFTYLKKDKSLNENVSPEVLIKKVIELLKLTFKHATLFTKNADYHVKMDKTGRCLILKNKPSQKEILLTHNRKKKYCLEEGKIIPFLIELGIMNSEGKVFTRKYAKFKQINRFLEMVEDTLPTLSLGPITIIDFGCGKAYLTFALYHYLSIEKKLPIKIIGIDLKSEVIQFCESLARKLNYTGLSFCLSHVEEFQYKEKVDMVLALHACDIATDLALEKAIKWQSKIILVAPCCQKELYHQIQNSMLHPMLKYGIIKERFSALLTDALRAQILEMLGYKTQILEFIETEHTSKNLLIRAIRQPEQQDKQKLISEYWSLKEYLNVDPFLARNLN